MSNTESNTAQTNLKQLTRQLIQTYQSVAVQQHSFFINDVSPDQFVTVNADILISMMSSLLYVTARCSKDSCIHVSAGSEGDMMTIALKDNNAVNNYAVLYEFQHLKILAQQLRGFLDINSVRNKETVISFSFNNMKTQAENAIIRELKRA